MVLIPTRESDFSLKSVHCSWANWLSVLQYYSCLCSWNLCCTLIVFRCVHSNQVSCGCFWLELGQFWKRMPFPFARAAEDVGSSCQGTNDFNLHLKSYPSLNRHLRLSGPVSSHEFWAKLILSFPKLCYLSNRNSANWLLFLPCRNDSLAHWRPRLPKLANVFNVGTPEFWSISSVSSLEGRDRKSVV